MAQKYNQLWVTCTTITIIFLCTVKIVCDILCRTEQSNALMHYLLCSITKIWLHGVLCVLNLIWYLSCFYSEVSLSRNQEVSFLNTCYKKNRLTRIFMSRLIKTLQSSLTTFKQKERAINFDEWMETQKRHSSEVSEGALIISKI